MASLTGSTIAASYEQLLSLPDGGLNGNTLVAITDGDSSTAIGMKVATNKIEVIPGSNDANAFEVSQADGTAILTVDSSTPKVTITGDTYVANGSGVIVGHTSQETISIGDGGTDLVPEVQILGTAQADASLMLAAFSTTATSAGAPLIALVKGGNGTIGSHTVVTDGEELGNIIAYGDDGTDLEAPAAQIQFEVDGTPGTGDMPGRMIFATTTDAGETLTERMRINAKGTVIMKADASGDADDFHKALHLSVDDGSVQDSGDIIGRLCFSGRNSGGPNKPVGIISGMSNSTWNETQDHGWGGLNFQVGSGANLYDMMTLNATGLGIGTASPLNESSGTLLHIHDSGGTNAAHINLSGGTGGNNNQTGKISFSDPEDPDDAVAFIAGNISGTDASPGGSLRFFTAVDGGSMTERMHIDESGQVGLGTSPTARLHILDWGFTDTDGQVGLKVEQKKTGGASDAADDYYGIYNNFEFDDGDAAFGILYGISNTCYNNQSGEASEQIATFNRALMDGSADVNDIFGSHCKTDIDGGTVDSNVYGSYTLVDIDGGTLSTHVFAHYVQVDTNTNPGGSIFCRRASMAGSGVDATADYFDFLYDSQNDDTVMQITALAGVATFDSGDFSGAPDYAEYFESKDGKAIAVGTTVKLDGDKVVACGDGDTPIGVVRPDGVGTSAYKAGAQNLRWHGKYLYDDFNELQMEDYKLTQWTESITEEEYYARGKDETGGSLGGNVRDEKVEGRDAIPAKDAVTRQKTVDEEVEEEVTTTELVDGKYVQKTETVTKTVKVPQYEEVDLYDKDGEVIGKHQVPIMETVEEAVAAVDAVPKTYLRKHSYHLDRLPDGVTPPDDAETVTPSHQRKKLNPDYDASKHDDYKSRPDRDEWNLIGLLGQIPITKGQPLADNWTKMKDVSDTVEMYFIK